FLYSHIVPWWGFAIGCFIVGASIPQKAWLSWLSGFAGLLICWGVLVVNMDQQNGGLLASKMAWVLPLKGSTSMLLAVTGFMGALIGGFAALSGAFLRKKKND